MFGEYFSNPQTVSYVGTLLDKEGVTLQEILEEVDIVYECEICKNKYYLYDKKYFQLN